LIQQDATKTRRAGGGGSREAHGSNKGVSPVDADSYVGRQGRFEFRPAFAFLAAKQEIRLRKQQEISIKTESKQQYKAPHGTHAALDAFCLWVAGLPLVMPSAAISNLQTAYLDASVPEAAGAAGVAGAAPDAGADASVVLCPPASPCMSILSPPFMMTNSASRAKAIKATKIFHMIVSRLVLESNKNEART